jgi:hypothetical protein
LAWIVCYTDFPAKSRRVSDRERELIERGKSEAQLELTDDIPYWVSFCGIISENCAEFFLERKI